MTDKEKILLSLNTEDSSINDFLHCYSVFGNIPNRYIIHSSVDYDRFKDLIRNLQIVNSITEMDDFSFNEKILCKYNDNIYISYFLLNSGTDQESIASVTFFHKKKEDLNDIDIESLYIEDEFESNINEDNLENYINIAYISNSVLDFKISPIEEIDIDLFELHYNEETFKNINKSIKNIKKKNKGLSLFFGERGTGKTNTIKYLANKLKKDILYIPNNLIEHTVNNPEFLNILSLYKSPLIILDDCEVLFNDLYNKSNVITNNLLQMVDGIESDQLEINLLLLFNCDESDIDENLLDCNNLINKVNFNYLSIDEAKELGKSLGKKIKINESSRLIDVLNNNKQKQNLIGF